MCIMMLCVVMVVMVRVMVRPNGHEMRECARARVLEIICSICCTLYLNLLGAWLRRWWWGGWGTRKAHARIAAARTVQFDSISTGFLCGMCFVCGPRINVSGFQYEFVMIHHTKYFIIYYSIYGMYILM